MLVLRMMLCFLIIITVMGILYAVTSCVIGNVGERSVLSSVFETVVYNR